MVIDAVKMALEGMDREYCILSQIDYRKLEVNKSIRENLLKEKNLTVIEFKLTSNQRDIEEDFKKLVEFKQRLGYKYLIQVIIGDSSSLENASRHIERISTNNGERIIIVKFNVETWTTEEQEIKYDCNIA